MAIPLHTQLAFVAQVVVCILGVWRFGKLSRELRVVAIYLVVSMAFSLTQYYFAKRNINNLWLTHFFTPIQYAFLAWTLSLWQRSPQIQRILQMSAVIFAAICLGSILLLENLRTFNIYSRPFESVLLVISSGYALYLLNKNDSGSLLRRPEFWVSSAILLYFSGMVVLYAMSNSFLRASFDTLRVAWIAHSVVSVIFSSLFAVAFLCKRTQ